MIKHRARILTFAIFLTVVFEISEQFLLFAINGNHRQTRRKVALNRSLNEAKLIVPVGMRLANLKQFLIELLAVSKLADKASNSNVTCLETLCRNDFLKLGFLTFVNGVLIYVNTPVLNYVNGVPNSYLRCSALQSTFACDIGCMILPVKITACTH